MTATLETLQPLEAFDALEQQALLTLKASAKQAFVTGAGGFLGKAICQRLIAAGIKVTGFARGDYPELSAMGVTMVKGDIADKACVLNAMQGCDLVFHVASKAGVWGSKQSYFSPNVDGAANIISACQQLNIDKLVYTSTPSVTFAGVDESGIDESAPYAETYLNYYGESKAIAEQMVIKANSSTLKTVSLRPHLIWGPQDPHLVPRVIERAKAGRLKLVGKEDKLVDTIYVGNAAYAHILAAVNLSSDSATAAGKAYFLSNDEPITMAAMLNKILACVDLPEVTKRVPSGVAYAAGVVLESAYGVLGKQDEPMMTRFVARQLSTSHYFDITAAKTDFGYSPIISIDQGMVKLREYLTS
ncbi:2-alkyl-3-oxoalkanoate reductase [Shewanella sp. UCD-KL12]|uniref:2-alkyl-3-oxoalkanoate reductase n=1 Tax=Shewanella sp. UCD-KL12 TaxID=1917163 RepID=UPI0009708528|nr:2-alkyl-3-oxoalkanoate reductase [Shewanella sp. UCD-KL12]